MRLSEIISKMNGVEKSGLDDPGITGLTADSREAGPGFLFAALPGTRADGASYIADAVRRGAAALLAAFVPEPDPGIPFVVANDVRKALGEAADAFYGNPSHALDLIGITGTNGKTTTAYLLRHILNHAGRRAGMLGTIEYDLGDKVEPAPLTTPDSVRFTRSLAEMRDFGCESAVVEVSSHALSQDRAWPHRFAAAVFTNLTRDHLDYHGDMESYFATKKLLFTHLPAGAVAVYNHGDAYGSRIVQGTAARKRGYFLAGGAEAGEPPANILHAELIKSDLLGQTFHIKGYGMERQLHTPLVGRHNVENCLGAFLAAVGLGIGEHTVAEALADFPGVPGRLERLESPSGIKAFVDYSHTDGALRSVLSVLRPLAKGKLITVFGCGGDRDSGKRPLMAKAAEEFSDLVVVTSDNPRTEDADKIINDIMPGFARPEKVTREPDRPTAVLLAIQMAEPGDTVLVAGKGHENYQIVGTEKHHMDDRELVRNAFMARD